MRKELNDFTAYMKVEKNYAKKTVINYFNDISQYSTMMDVYDVKNISVLNIRAYLAKLQDEGIAPSSRNRKLAAIRSFCKFLYENRMVLANPSTDIHTAKLEKRLPITMTETETDAIIESTENTRDRAMLEMLYGLGVRVSELAFLKFMNINLEAKRVLVFGKGGKERVVPVNGASIRAIEQLIKERGGVQPNEYLFPSPHDSSRPISAKAIYDIVVKYAKLNNLEKITPHKFRHTFATHLHAKDMDIRDIQELLGHVDISSTQIYTKVLGEKLSKSYHQIHRRG